MAAPGSFIGDFYVREGKQQVTWMDELRRHDQTSGTTQTPIAYSLFNFARPSEGQPTCSVWGKQKPFSMNSGAAYSLLSTVPYPPCRAATANGLSGNAFPDVDEKFVTTPEIAGELKHHTTGRPMPLELIDKVRQADNFCYGHVMLEFLASCVTDLRFYSHTDDVPKSRSI